MRRPAIVLTAFGLLWGLSVGAAMMVLWQYETGPGRAGDAPRRWPATSRLARRSDLPTLVMILHPRCPCSRASLTELDRLLAGAGNKLQAHALFVRPPGVGQGWEESDTWQQATSIPSLQVHVDPDGIEAAHFGAATSGQVTLYSPDGRLLFSGGITPARGHTGDSRGQQAIAALLTDRPSTSSDTAVFGCPLQEPEASSTRGESWFHNWTS